MQFESTSEMYRQARIVSIAQLNFGAAFFFHQFHQQHKGISNAYNRGVEFMHNFDDQYRVFIGSKVSQTVQVPVYNPQCQCIVNPSWSNETIVINIDPNQIPSGYNCETFPNSSEINYYLPAHLVAEGVTCSNYFDYNTVIEWINKPSDGVVLAESAMNIPQATWAPQPVHGSTHMAIRNDKNMPIALKKIFDGGVGDFFETDEK